VGVLLGDPQAGDGARRAKKKLIEGQRAVYKVDVAPKTRGMAKTLSLNDEEK